MLTSCGGSSVRDSIPPKTITAKDACPELDPRVLREAERRTGIPAGQMTKSQVMNLFRKYATNELRKNYTISQVADLYNKCRNFWVRSR